MSDTFEWPVRVYWEDTDAGGVVYHSNYLCFMERARSEWLRARGIDQRALKEAMGLQFVVAGMDLQFRRPAQYDDALIVTARLAEVGGATFRFEQEVRRGAELLVSAVVRCAAIDAASFKPRRLPTDLSQQLAQVQ
jgi:acyl-CoA thioester hydrolase